MWLSAYSTEARDPLHFGPSPVGTFSGHGGRESRAIGACLGQLLGDVLAGVVDVAGSRCLALCDLGPASGRARDAYEGAGNKQYGEADRWEHAPLFDCGQPVMARRNRDDQHCQRHHVVCSDVRRRPYIPEQDDNGANREQDAERNCTAASDSNGASLS